MFTKTTLFHKPGEGGGSGGDQHNLGWYATQSALEEAHPTAEAGDWAIVGSTDTVWIWDTDNEEWVDSDQKGQVASVNGQTGVVSLGINDVAPTQTGKSGYVLGTDGFVAGWVKPEIVQRSALPQASEEEVGNIYQYVGTTDANYTNGYFYKCVSDGQTPATYSWERVDAQPAPVIPDPLPSQTGQSGKFLTTDGTDASWATVNALQNTATGSNSLTILGTPSAFRDSLNIGTNSQTYYNYTLAIGKDAKALGTYAVAIGISSTASNTNARVIGTGTASGSYSLVLGSGEASATGATQIGSTWGTNAVANTVKFANQNGNFEIMSADGTIPAARHAALPSADGTYVLKLVIASGVPTLSWVAE